MKNAKRKFLVLVVVSSMLVSILGSGYGAAKALAANNPTYSGGTD